ncbi:MAG: hypothetical protein RMK97_05590 [Sutterellaceae bacterium]|nr:hypothetical protein [Burkholderiaceae bacterium]MDW8429962.1 hypothetical protein [Sutterellaceae bacterium]
MAAPRYALVDPLPATVGTLRWGPVLAARWELAAGLLPRHELRLSGFAAREPAAATEFGAVLRATYRYAFFEQHDWSWKLGLTARRVDGPDISRFRLGGRPQLHLASQVRFSSQWQLDLDADGQWPTRGRLLDIGVRVSYLLGRSFALYGSYRQTESAVDAEELTAAAGYGATFGLRYRF